MEELSNNTQQMFQNAIRTDVVIVGGGISGVTALKFLLDLGVESILLEAQDKIGGRISSNTFGDVILEDGAEWIHGEERNPLFRIALNENQLAPAYDDEIWELIIAHSNGTTKKGDGIILSLVDRLIDSANGASGVLRAFYGQGFGAYFIDKLKKGEIIDRTGADFPAWTHYFEQRINSDEGIPNWTDINTLDADNYVDYGEDSKWKNGYNFVFKYLMKNISSEKIRLASPVRQIIWDDVGSDEVLVKTDSQNYVANHVIVTPSIAYLKKNHQSLFMPTLPNEIISNYEGIFLGNANKVFIGWDTQWWKEECLYLCVIWTTRDLPAEMEWMYGISDIYSEPDHPSILLTFLSGNFSTAMAELSEQEVNNHFLYLLRKLLPTHNIPDSNFIRRTTWSQNPWIIGSYSSYITNEGYSSGIRSREPFRRPLLNKNGSKVVMWAGEHTHDERYGTADGAYSSGIRVAKEVAAALKLPGNWLPSSPLSTILSMLSYVTNVF